MNIENVSFYQARVDKKDRQVMHHQIKIEKGQKVVDLELL